MVLVALMCRARRGRASSELPRDQAPADAFPLESFGDAGAVARHRKHLDRQVLHVAIECPLDAAHRLDARAPSVTAGIERLTADRLEEKELPAAQAVLPLADVSDQQRLADIEVVDGIRAGAARIDMEVQHRRIVRLADELQYARDRFSRPGEQVLVLHFDVPARADTPAQFADAL